MKQFFKALIICSIILNGVSPNAFAEVCGSGTLQEAFTHQPLYQCYSSFSNLPVVIVSKLFVDTAAQHSNKADKKEKNKSNTSSSSCILTYDNSSKIIKKGKLEQSFFGFVPNKVILQSRDEQDQKQPSSVPPGFLNFYILLILTMFILLPRGSVDSLMFVNKKISV